MKKTALTIAFAATLTLGGCATLDEAMGASSLDGDTSGMSCEQMANRYTEIASSQRRVQAMARLSGSDTNDIRKQYSEVLAQVRDAQIAAGCM